MMEPASGFSFSMAKAALQSNAQRHHGTLCTMQQVCISTDELGLEYAPGHAKVDQLLSCWIISQMLHHGLCIIVYQHYLWPWHLLLLLLLLLLRRQVPLQHGC
jgi:hypothetical protein